MLLHLPEGHDAITVRDQMIPLIKTLPAHLRRSLTWSVEGTTPRWSGRADRSRRSDHARARERQASRRGRTPRTHGSWLVGGVDAQHRKIGVGGVVDDPAEATGRGGPDVLDVDGVVAGQGQRGRSGAGLGETDDGGSLCGFPLGDEVGAADGGDGVVGAEERLVEQAEEELLAQQPAYRDVDAFFADPS